MLYVPVDVGLREHRKLDDFMDAAKIETTAEATGVLVCLWTWALGQEIDSAGVLPPMSGKTWTRALGCREANTVAYRDALTTVGFLDCDGESYAIHNWEHHAGSIVTLRAKRATAARLRRNGHVAVTSPKRDGTIDLTGLDLTESEKNGEDKSAVPQADTTPPFVAEVKLPVAVPDDLKDLPRFVACPRLVNEWQTLKYEWSTTYPGVDVVAELRKAHAWQNANPKRAKTAKGQVSFLVNWLSRAQDSPKRVSNGHAPKSAQTEFVCETVEDVLRRRDAAKAKASAV